MVEVVHEGRPDIPTINAFTAGFIHKKFLNFATASRYCGRVCSGH